MITCTRILEFDFGHRVLNHESKCRNWHGHRGKVEITATASELDSIGRIIDFSVLKEKVGAWIDTYWDHTVLIYEKDVESVEMFQKFDQQKAPFICQWNPTAENIANYLLKEVCPMLLANTGVSVVKVIFHETPNGRAEATL